MKKVLAILSALVLVAQVQPAYAEDRFDLGDLPIPGGGVLMQVYESDLLESASSIHSGSKDKSGMTQKEMQDDFKSCTSLSDPNCNPLDSKRAIGATSVFPHCSAGISDICLEGLSISINGQPSTSATFLRMANDGMSVTADSKYRLLAGGSTSLFEFKDSVSGQTMNFSATVKATQQYNFAKKQFEIPFLNATVLPYRLQAGSEFRYGSGGSSACSFVETGACGAPQNYPDGISIKLVFRAPSEVGGWFRGRMRNPQIEVTKFNSKINRIAVEAAPIDVPKVGIAREIPKLAPQEKVWFDTYSKWGTKSGMASGMDASFADAFKFVDYFRAETKDSISGKSSSWFLTTVDAGRGSGCLADTSKVQGIVTTNSLVYDGSAPTFSGGFLNYKVGGMHFESDGTTPFQGSYDLVMRSDTARCLYGFSKAPLSATVSVVNEKGTKTTATTVVSEKNGWLKMAAYGFTFSKKTIKVKITKKKK